MNFELSQLFLIGVSYLLILFGIAHITERGWVPAKIVNHPLTYVLSLGIFASAWSLFGVVGLAHNYGYGYLSYYLGIAAAFMFAPLLLLPLLRITRTYLHSSLADLLTFRYRSQLAGSLITVFLLIAVLPLLALQIQAVSDTVYALTEERVYSFAEASRDHRLALIICAVITVFTISFGSRHLTAHEKHSGLVMAIAFESLVKLSAFMVLGGVAIFGVFGGFDGLESWLNNNREIVSLLSYPMREDSARSLLLIFFSSAVVMPHLFHMIFAENPSIKAMNTASWGVPLFLLLMSIPVLPILWSGYKLETYLPPEYFSLGLGIELQSPLLSTLTFIGGLSAASGSIIVITLALASMCLKHLVLPLYRPRGDRDIYRWLLWIRRLLIIFIILTGYLFFRLNVGRETLSNLGLASFIATLQFLPGVIAGLYWQGANRKGLIAGLIAGFGIWFATLLLPLISSFDAANLGALYFGLIHDELWSAAALLSLGVNSVLLLTVSLLSKTSAEEVIAGELYSSDDLNRPTRRNLSIRSPQEMKERLATALGQRMAIREVDRALQELQLNDTESRPFALRRLRYRLEANLSSLLGPSVAADMINQLVPFDSNTSTGQGEDLNLIEVQLENYKVHLTGLAADLDNLRRYHRQTLQHLPVGVCVLGQDGEILMWNDSIAEFTGIMTFDVIGSHLPSLPNPWGEVLTRFIQASEDHLYKQSVDIQGRQCWINLHKTARGLDDRSLDGQVIVLEDATDVQLLENELAHSERLASIGRLAAGVAHEIGNPVTGIACLAQNLRYDSENPETLSTAQEILQQTDRISKIVQTLVNFAHAGTASSNKAPKPVSVHECAAEAIHLLQLNKEARQVVFEQQTDPAHFILGDGQRLLQVFVNLLSNARDASEEGAPVIIASRHTGPHVLITVTDRGTGISKQHQEQIFEPFFTTKEAGKGTGLGLALVYSILEDLNGNITVQSPADPVHGGTRFTIRLPRSDTH